MNARCDDGAVDRGNAFERFLRIAGNDGVGDRGEAWNHFRQIFRPFDTELRHLFRIDGRHRDGDLLEVFTAAVGRHHDFAQLLVVARRAVG